MGGGQLRKSTAEIGRPDHLADPTRFAHQPWAKQTNFTVRGKWFWVRTLDACLMLNVFGGLQGKTAFAKRRCEQDRWFCLVVFSCVEITHLTLPFNFNSWAFCHTQTLPQKFKAFLIQWLCQDVCYLFLSPAMF